MHTLKTSCFPAHYRVGDKLGWLALRAFCIAVLLFLLLPIFVIVPLSFSSGSFLAYPVPGGALQWYRLHCENAHFVLESTSLLGL